jgi:hypothetical protein
MYPLLFINILNIVLCGGYVNNSTNRTRFTRIQSPTPFFDYQLYLSVMKYIITESKIEQVVIKYLNKYYGDLEEYRTDKVPNSVLFIKGKKVYMEHELKYDELNVDFTIWKDLKNTFSLKNDDIQSIILRWAEETYNIRDVIPYESQLISMLVVEDTYKLK